MIKGSIVAIVTPFKDGKVDKNKLKELIEFQIANGTDGILPCGTTGESATLTHEEHEEVIEFAIETVAKRVPVIAGTGSNSTAEAIRLTKFAKKVGADAALLITPYYNKPTQKGLIAHFKAIAEAVDIPLIPYNVPSRTGVNLLPETMAEMAGIPNIVGIKEASGNLQQITDLIRLCGDKITVLSGDDFIILPIMAVGGKGIISVVANIIPKDVATLVDAFDAGDWKKALEYQIKIFPLCTAMFIETNPIPVKESLYLMGKIGPEMRLPMCPMSDSNREKMKKALKDYELI